MAEASPTGRLAEAVSKRVRGTQCAAPLGLAPTPEQAELAFLLLQRSDVNAQQANRSPRLPVSPKQLPNRPENHNVQLRGLFKCSRAR